MTFTPFNTGRMNLVIAIVSRRDADELESALIRRGHQAVVIDESAAAGRMGNATLLMGVQETWLFDLMEIIEQTCRGRVHAVNPAVLLADPQDVVSRSIDAREGGAVVFTLNLDRYERIA